MTFLHPKIAVIPRKHKSFQANQRLTPTATQQADYDQQSISDLPSWSVQVGQAGQIKPDVAQQHCMEPFNKE
jgi:hypothetical protein